MQLKPHFELPTNLRHEPIDNPSDSPKRHHPYDMWDFESLAFCPKDSCFAPTMAE